MSLLNYVALFLVASYTVQCRTILLETNPPSPDEISFMKKNSLVSEEQQGKLTYTAACLAKPASATSIKKTAIDGLEPIDQDVETKQFFGKKRCGFLEIPKANRSRRYVINSQGWNKRNITYRVLNGARTMRHERVEQLMEKALAVWAPHSGLHFTRIDSGTADMIVSFVRGDHGDGAPFDGLGHLIAHAFSPPFGAIHFDDDEIWSDDVRKSEEDDNVSDFFTVAVHEIGHALGLGHSETRDSIMYSFYQTGVTDLHHDDIEGLKQLYFTDKPEGKPDIPDSAVHKPDIPEEPQTMNFNGGYMEKKQIEDEKPDLCMTNYDTLQVIHGKIYVFEEEWLWVMRDRNEMEEGYPRRLHDVFRGLPAHVTVIKTIYEKANGNVVIFAGRKFWEFDPTFQLIKVGSISEYSIPSQVPELTTVFMSNNKTYLIEEDRFWRYDEKNRKMDRGFPKMMSAWRRVPYPVDAAIVWEGDTFFFQGPRFWRYDYKRGVAHHNYPVPVAPIWFSCKFQKEMNEFFEMPADDVMN